MAKSNATTPDLTGAIEPGDTIAKAPTAAAPPRHGRSGASATLLRIAESYALFHTADGTCFADLIIRAHRWTQPIQSKDFRNRLAYDFYIERGEAPPSEALASVLGILKSQAAYDGPTESVHLRVAEEGDRLYLDADDQRRAVEIFDGAWRVVSDPPARFPRLPGMAPLPSPERGGSIKDLEPFINITDPNELVLVISWMLAAMRPRGPYPVLAVSGEQGSAKSTLSRTIRSLIDPNASPIRTMPQTSRDIFIAAKHNHVLSFDNLSTIPNSVSDTLCRLSTGGGFATRRLRTDEDEVLFYGTRPIIFNGISEVVTRPDLADRAIFISLDKIARPQPEAQLAAEFESARPAILGALLDATAHGHFGLPDVHLNEYSRMADFARVRYRVRAQVMAPWSFCGRILGKP